MFETVSSSSSFGFGVCRIVSSSGLVGVLYPHDGHVALGRVPL